MSSQRQLSMGNKVSLEPLKIQCSPGSRGLLRAQAMALNFCCAMSCLPCHMILSNHFPLFTSLLLILFGFFFCFHNSSSIPLHSTQVYTAHLWLLLNRYHFWSNTTITIASRKRTGLGHGLAEQSSPKVDMCQPGVPEKNLSTLSVDHHGNILLWYTQFHQGECRNHHNFTWTSILVRLAPK